MKTNKQMIKKAFKAFDNGELEEAQKLCKRITANFEMDDDFYDWSITAEVYQPYKQTADELIESGREDLVWDNPLNKGSFNPDKFEVRVRIESKSKNGIIVKGNKYVDDYRHFPHQSFRIGRTGKIESSVGNLDHAQKEKKKFVKQWLKREFGKCLYGYSCEA